jgi:hypothetical protein
LVSNRKSASLSSSLGDWKPIHIIAIKPKAKQNDATVVVWQILPVACLKPTAKNKGNHYDISLALVSSANVDGQKAEHG